MTSNWDARLVDSDPQYGRSGPFSIDLANAPDFDFRDLPHYADVFLEAGGITTAYLGRNHLDKTSDKVIVRFDTDDLKYNARMLSDEVPTDGIRNVVIKGNDPGILRQTFFLMNAMLERRGLFLGVRRAPVLSQTPSD